MAAVGKVGIGAGFGSMSLSNDSITWRAKLSYITLLLLWGYAFFPTLRSMFISCTHSTLNQHCFLVMPLFIWLLLSKRSVFTRISPSVSQLALLLLLILSSLWIFALITRVDLLQQICVLALVPVIFMLAFGYKISKFFLFPFGYIFLLLPVGHLVIPNIQNALLDGLVKAFVFSDLPIFWENQSIRTMHSELNVAAFSYGLTFSLAFLAIGFIYSYCVAITLVRRFIVAISFVLFPIMFMFLGTYAVIRYELIANSSALNIDMLACYGWCLISIGLLASIILGWSLKQSKPYYNSLTGVDWQSSWKYTNFQWLRPTLIAAVIFIMIPYVAENIKSLEYSLHVVSEFIAVI